MEKTSANLEALLERLLHAGKEPDQALLEQIKALGPLAVPRLIEMATDDGSQFTAEDDPRVWASLHAVRLLGDLRAAEAVEPLLPLLEVDDDWLHEELPEVFGRIGRPALAPLRAVLFDRGTDMWARGRASAGMAHVAREDPSTRDEVVAALVQRLDPEHTREPDDETLNGMIIGDLCDLEAEEAAAAIHRAFAEDRVDLFMIGPDDVARHMDLPGAPLPARRGEPADGLQLGLRCTACGFKRRHDVGKVYYDWGTAERRKKGEETPYSEYILTRRITCPKCGAVDQYEFTSEAYLALMAEVMKLVAAKEEPARPASDEPSRLSFTHFTIADGREMHPYAARDMYRQQVEAAPDRADLRVRYGNVLGFLGYTAEATEQYNAALEVDPTNVESYLSLGMFAQEAGRRAEARRMMRRVVELAPGSNLPREQREDWLAYAREALAELDERSGPGPARGGVALDAPPARPPLAATPTPPQAPRQVRKVGRNDPCPCGSGKKYKKCHGQ